MPVESPEYDTFDYKHFDEPALSLEEATKKAHELRVTDAGNFHRIVPKDSEMTVFGVETVPIGNVYAELLNRWTVLLNRFATRSMKR